MTGTGTVFLSRRDSGSRSSSAPTITMPPGCQELRSNRAVNQCTSAPGPPASSLTAVCDVVVAGIDHHDDRRLAVEHADGGLVVTDHRGDRAGQHVARIVQSDRDDVVETGVCQGLQQQCRFGGRLVAPGHADDVHSLVVARRGGLRIQHRGACLFGGINRLQSGRRDAPRSRRGRGSCRRRRGLPPGPSQLTSTSVTVQVPCPNLHLNRGPMPVRRNLRPDRRCAGS